MRGQGPHGAELSHPAGSTQHDTAMLLLMGSMLATFGCALLAASVVDLSTPTIVARADVAAIRDVAEPVNVSIALIPDAVHRGQARPQAGSQRLTWMAWGDVRATTAQDTLPGFSGVATNSGAQDPGETLAVMAAAMRSQGRATDWCPCLMDIPSRPAGHVNSDDRIANALFGSGSDGVIPPRNQHRFQ